MQSNMSPVQILISANFTIETNSGAEIADAETLEDAIYGARLLAKEEEQTMVVTSPRGDAVAWARPDGLTWTVQGVSRC